MVEASQNAHLLARLIVPAGALVHMPAFEASDDVTVLTRMRELWP